MHLTDHAFIGSASKIPVNPPCPVLSFSPVVLSIADRQVDLQVRVSAPATGTSLPIVLFSHGHGQSNYLSSLEGYAPICDFWAGHGFVVIQPTHLTSRSLGIPINSSNIRDIYLDSRARDMSRIIDHLDDIEATVPLLKGRLDKSKIAVAGHSMGARTASALLGATNTDPRDSTVSDLGDSRIKAGVIIGGSGKGGADLNEAGRNRTPYHGPDFSQMHTPTLVVWGDDDAGSHFTSRGPNWHKDSYTLAPEPKDAFMVRGGKHGFGGISGWDAGEVDDPSPERLAAVLRVTWAWLRSQLHSGDRAWEEACEALKGLEGLGMIESK